MVTGVRRITARGVARWLHRWSGLTTALFLLIAGTTGSVLAFGDELDAWLNADLFEVSPGASPQVLTPMALARSVEAADPRLRVSDLPLRVEAGEALEIGVMPQTDPATGRPFALGFSTIFVDPASGSVIGTRDRGLGLGRRHVIETIERLHSSLLAGPMGRAFMGGVAIVWVVNCGLGLWLTLPAARPLLVRWGTAWRIRRGAGSLRLILDLHRAGALWTWFLLLALAISSVDLGLYQPVFRPVVGLFSPLTPSLAEQGQSRLRMTPVPARLNFADAITAAERESAARGWHLLPVRVHALPAYGVFLVTLSATGEDDPPGLGVTRLFIDDQDGRAVTTVVPGVGSWGDVFLQAQFPIHSGTLAGLPGRMAICGAGLVVAMLSVTGVLLWWRKRRNRASVRLRSSPQSPGRSS
jgi:uncharacterized iron-regulated membrane protein